MKNKMADMPDLSHLTAEERAIIESVIMRQKQEEEREHEIMKKKQDEVQVLEKTIRQRSEQHKKAGIELDATCHICLKTKFADGVGHICNYCNIRCCARCGGKVTLRSNKVIWVCILCRKKQELLSKTGQWMNKTVTENGIERKLSSAGQCNDKPKLERSKSASDKENTFIRTGSVLRRQYSEHDDSNISQVMQPNDKNTNLSFNTNQTAEYEHQDPVFYRNEIDDLIRSHPHLVPHIRPVPCNDFNNTGTTEAVHVIPLRTQQQLQRQHNYEKNMQFSQQQPQQQQAQYQYHQQQQEHDQKLITQNMANFKKHKRNNSLKKNLERQQLSFSSSDDDDLNIIRNKPKIDQTDFSNKKQIFDEKMNKFLSYPVSWKISADGVRLIGHMVLRKTFNDGVSPGSGASILGLKVVGGKMFEDRRRGALVEKVKKGSVADIEGKIQPGDEIVEWNRYLLQNKSYQEVYDIIRSTKHEPQIELLVSRLLDNRAMTTHSSRNKPRINTLSKVKPSVMITSPSSPDYHSVVKQTAFPRLQNSHDDTYSNVSGKLKMKLGYDHTALQLIVTVECCVGLSCRQNGQFRNPYAKIFLLPNRSEKSKRRTKTLANTNDPYWNQMFVYSGLTKSELKTRTLEVSVWDYVKYGANDFLGEILIDLHLSALKDNSEWFVLMEHEDISSQDYMNFHRNDQESIDFDIQLTPSDHLSPPSTVSRLSDSDTPSECDIDSNRYSLERIADGVSMSSFGSSSSPPTFDHSEMSQSFRKDLSPHIENRKFIDQNLYDLQYSKSRRKYRLNNNHSYSPPPEAYNVDSFDQHSFNYPHGIRFQSRSATTTPTGSPKKRLLPQVPQTVHTAFRERVVHDLEERAHIMRHRMKHLQRYRNVASEGWERNCSGLSDSDIATHSSQQYLRKYKSLRSPEHELPSSDQNDSDLESIASVTSSALSTQSEKPRGSIVYSNNIETNYKNRQLRENYDSGRPSQFSRSLSNENSNNSYDGNLSDTAVCNNITETNLESNEIKNYQSMETNRDQSLHFNKKSNSTSQLSATGRKRRIGFGVKGKSTFTVHRSEEIGPSDRNLLKNSYSLSTDADNCSVEDDRSQEVAPFRIYNGERDREGDKNYISSSIRSVSSSESSVTSPSLKISNENGNQLAEFIDGLGPGQLVGRQVLGSSSLGDIQLSLCYQKGYLEVEVIRARGLQAKIGCKTLPAPYVKVYLVKGKKCIEKAKTAIARRTLDPLYQQQLAFREPFEGCVLQVTVWGDYGRIEGKKVFMGVAQIMLDDLNLSNIVIGWYKLFGTTSLVNFQTSLETSNRNSINNLESLKL